MSSKGNGINLLPFKYRVGMVVCCNDYGAGVVTDERKDDDGNSVFTVVVAKIISPNQVYTSPYRYVDSNGFLIGKRHKADGSNRFIPYDVYLALLCNGIVGCIESGEILDSMEFIHEKKPKLLKTQDIEKGWYWHGPYESRCKA